ncbi:MAG: glycine cleavage system aminomethyltransferase GcvT [Planctomycetota bacterium]|nr:glycine cleavage system aminomethyltransferase GcvT [Planctomycetota bacterium]MDA1179273.1 glycine cleavage system aminomethyltransferase GcvT [Planctomycetota bacterium]
MSNESTTLLHTPLHAAHEKLKARLVDFAGWSMPVQYASILAEHRATREHVGLFDVSHMGRFQIRGRDAGRLLEGILTRRVDDLPAGRIRYSLVTQDDGGVLDDVLAYRHSAPDDGYLLIVNASNRARILAWIDEHRPAGCEAVCTDTTCDTAMIAVQGPHAMQLASRVLDTDGLASDPRKLRYYAHATVRWRATNVLVSRTGYTGEDGVEVILPSEFAAEFWDLLTVTEIQGQTATPAGLGARDTLRLEAAMPLYGHELETWCDPWQAGLAFAVDLDGRHFPGSDALTRNRSMPPTRQRVGLLLSGRRAARLHCPILAGGEPVGEITSGTYSPTLEQPIAMGYVPPDWAALDTELEIDVRGSIIPARVVRLPFYRRKK